MIKSAILLPDVHLDTKTYRDYRLVRDKFIPEFKPNTIVLQGDFMDVSALSAWDNDKKRKMEGQRFIKECNLANQELDYLQQNCKELIYIGGNHEFRIDRYLDKNPEMEGLIDLPVVLNFKKRPKLKYTPYDGSCKLGKLNVTHIGNTNQNHAKKTLEQWMDNVCYCHTHQAQSFFRTGKNKHPIMAYCLGTLGNKAPEYMVGKWTNWISEFAVIYWDDKTGNFNLYPINIINHSFIFNGRLYK